MRAVVQRVSEASVTMQLENSSEERLCGRISNGILVYVGVGIDDTDEEASYLAEKIAHLRIFMDQQQKMNLSVLDLGYEALVISQFTLYADARKGRRPSYSQAAEPARARHLYELFCKKLRDQGLHVQTGMFQETMRLRSTNEGPVTILLDTKN